MEKTLTLTEDLHISDFVKMVSDTLKEDYGQHLYQRFVEELQQQLKNEE